MLLHSPNFITDYIVLSSYIPHFLGHYRRGYTQRKEWESIERERDGMKKKGTKKHTEAIEDGKMRGGREASANLQMEGNRDWILRPNRTGNFLLTNSGEKGGSRGGGWAGNFTSSERRDTFTWRRRCSKRWMFPNNSQDRSLTCHETFNSSASRLIPLTANFVPRNSCCLDPTSLIALPRNLAEKSSGQEIIRLRNRLSYIRVTLRVAVTNPPLPP